MIEKYAIVKVVKKIARERAEFSMRDAGRLALVAPSTAKAALDFLERAGVVEKRRQGSLALFRMKDGFLTRQLKVLYSLAEIRAAGLVEEILSNCPDALCILLYGSVAKGLDDADSDIDLLVFTPRRSRPLRLKAERRLGREVSIRLLTPAEWREIAKGEKTFYDNVLLYSIPLHGEKLVVT